MSFGQLDNKIFIITCNNYCAVENANQYACLAAVHPLSSLMLDTKLIIKCIIIIMYMTYHHMMIIVTVHKSCTTSRYLLLIKEHIVLLQSVCYAHAHHT